MPDKAMQPKMSPLPGKWRDILSEPWILDGQLRGYLEEWVCPHCSCTTPELTPYPEMKSCCFSSLMAWEKDRRERLTDAG